MAGAFPFVSVNVRGTDGPWLLLIHGWSCNSALWDDLVPLLTRWCRVVTCDLPGHGSSSTGRPVTIVEMAEAVVMAIETLKIDKPVLVGHSMGGPVALETAILLGRNCPLAIGIDTFTDAAFYTRRPAIEIEERVQTFSADFVATMTRMVRRITRSGPASLAEEIARMMAGSDPVSVLPALRSLLDWDIAERWPLVSCRVETINSAPLTCDATLIELPGLAVHLMEGVGHFPMCEAPDRLAALIRDIIERSSVADGPKSG